MKKLIGKRLFMTADKKITGIYLGTVHGIHMFVDVENNDLYDYEEDGKTVAFELWHKCFKPIN